MLFAVVAWGVPKQKNEYAAGLELDRHRLALVGGMAASVVVAVGIAPVRHKALEGARDDPDGAVGQGGVVDRDPHRGPDHGIGEVEVGVVLVPVGADAHARWLEEDLVEELVRGVAHELRHRLAHAGVKDQGGEEAVVAREWADLQVLLVGAGGGAVAFGGDVGEYAGLLELGQAAAQRRHLGRAEEVGNRQVALAAKVGDLFCRERHRIPHQIARFRAA